MRYTPMPMRRWMPRLLLVPAAVMIVELVATVGCDKLSQPRLLATAATTQETTGVADFTGDSKRGRGLFAVYGCTACHEIPGVAGADGVVGPPLERMAQRGYVAGVVKNTPYNLVRWIKNPLAVDPLTAMPNLHVTDKDARDMGAYLYTLR